MKNRSLLSGISPLNLDVNYTSNIGIKMVKKGGCAYQKSEKQMVILTHMFPISLTSFLTLTSYGNNALMILGTNVLIMLESNATTIQFTLFKQSWREGKYLIQPVYLIQRIFKILPRLFIYHHSSQKCFSQVHYKKRGLNILKVQFQHVSSLQNISVSLTTDHIVGYNRK